MSETEESKQGGLGFWLSMRTASFKGEYLMTYRATLAQRHSAPATELGLFQAVSSEAQIGRWRINGFPAHIIIWTAEEWDSLTDRPTDAQYYPCGVWCALRME